MDIVHAHTHTHNTVLMAIFLVSRLSPWFSSHPYLEDSHRWTGQSSSVSHGPMGCTLQTYINYHPEGFWSRSFSYV